MIRAWLKRRRCFHHDHHTGQTWIKGQLIDMGIRKIFRCTHCGKTWIT